MRTIDAHVHPINPAYVEASAPFMPAARGMFAARPDLQIAEDLRRDDATRILKLESAVAHVTAAKA